MESESVLWRFHATDTQLVLLTRIVLLVTSKSTVAVDTRSTTTTHHSPTHHPPKKVFGVGRSHSMLIYC